MNTTTIGNIPSTNWKRIKGQYVAAAAGVALAVSAVVTFGGTGESSPQPTLARPVPSVAAFRDSSPAKQYFYIVADEAERSGLMGAIQEAQLNSYDTRAPQFNSAVIVAGSNEARALLAHGVQEMNALDTPFAIIETVNAAPSTSVPSARTASDADIIAGVLSTELANFAAPAVQAQPQFGTDADAEYAARGLAGLAPLASVNASDADIMAGVLSTELANYAAPVQVAPAQLSVDLPASVAIERANLMTLQEQILVGQISSDQRQASDADIMSSVISTERAAYGE